MSCHMAQVPFHQGNSPTGPACMSFGTTKFPTERLRYASHCRQGTLTICIHLTSAILPALMSSVGAKKILCWTKKLTILYKSSSFQLPRAGQLGSERLAVPVCGSVNTLHIFAHLCTILQLWSFPNPTNFQQISYPQLMFSRLCFQCITGLA